MPQTTTIRRCLPTTPKRRKQTGGRPGRTLGGGSRVQRGQLKPRTLTLRTSHFPDLPKATLQPTAIRLLTQRGAVYNYCRDAAKIDKTRLPTLTKLRRVARAR